MKLDLFIQITSNPNTYTVSYMIFDDDGIMIDSKKTTYICSSITKRKGNKQHGQCKRII
jgi:hypothetical protein